MSKLGVVVLSVDDIRKEAAKRLDRLALSWKPSTVDLRATVG